MDARKIQVKVFIQSPAELDIDPIVPVFHDWIRKNTLEELLIDVTDYGHVHQGPALLLVGHASDYCIDFAEGRAGLFYSRKRQAPGDFAECVTDAIRRAFFAAKKLEGESSLQDPIRFRGNELLIRINDRLLAPNTKETVREVEPVLREVLSKVYPDSSYTLEPVGTPRDLFGMRVLAPKAPSVTDLLARIA